MKKISGKKTMYFDKKYLMKFWSLDYIRVIPLYLAGLYNYYIIKCTVEATLIRT